MRAYLTACVTLTVIACAGWSAQDTGKDKDKAAAKKELEALSATWEVQDTTLEGGEVIPEGKIRPLLTIKDGKFSMKMPNGEVLGEGPVKVDPTTNPKGITLTAGKARPQQALYELAGDELRICFGPPGGPRPKSMKPQGAKETMVTYKRVKP